MQTLNPVWNVAPRDLDAEARLERELGIHPLVAVALVHQGVTDPALAHKFLHPDLADLYSPKLLPDFDAALKAILNAKELGQKIYIHGDYDVDGVTSASLLTRFLKRLGFDVHTHVPHRMKEGYGIHEDAVAAAAATGAKLFLTCDCGGSAFEQVKEANALGMTVVVTDHHHVGDEHPEAAAFVNPHRLDSKYPFPNLCGAGVAFKLCQGIVEELGMPIDKFQRAYLDLVALGTVADVMPLVDENRILVRHGIPLIAQSQKPGIRALIREAGLEEKAQTGFDTYSVGFSLGPRLNAAGRIDDAALALRLLLAEDDETATPIAKELEGLNKARRDQQDSILKEALEMIHATGQAEAPVIIVGKEGWHPGIVGIVAGRLKDQFHRPVFVMTVDSETGDLKGSGRSIPGFHLAEAIKAHPELMDGGGHAKAAGMSVKADMMDQAREKLLEFAAETLTEEDLTPQVHLAAEVPLAEIDYASVEELNLMAPFGEANREPVFYSHGVTLEAVHPTRNPDHPFVSLRDGDRPALKAKAFRLGQKFMTTHGGQKLDIAYTVGIDEWRGQRSMGVTVKDFRPS